ncbi:MULTISPECIES: hypothetical protein [unclassified Fusibacter]|uniref:hypothetical protein n=1 Tax=unclassified Fusibacter TaxID=2624464 RepID=UPI00101242F3|nr:MULTISPECIES: hypothetical protein [unclassified Fusibacter]MCK8060439.1 hypothetical protein [Fusibacter sp. A2]NPE20272.1 hypothetical protein [Fusibacter sp. A1]RXV63478.1 hypothetical protein DWB64_00470 [Fusibacter sp. A1]
MNALSSTSFDSLYAIRKEYNDLRYNQLAFPDEIYDGVPYYKIRGLKSKMSSIEYSIYALLYWDLIAQLYRRYEYLLIGDTKTDWIALLLEEKVLHLAWFSKHTYYYTQDFKAFVMANLTADEEIIHYVNTDNQPRLATYLLQ